MRIHFVAGVLLLMINFLREIPANPESSTTDPETAVPETADPETAVPETAVPETAVPETATPDTQNPTNTTKVGDAPLTTPQSLTGGSVDTTICQLYSQIPTIISACQQLQSNVAQALSYVPNATSPPSLIMQYVELIDIQAYCDMIIKTQQLTDQLQKNGGESSQSTTSAPTSPTTATNPTGSNPVQSTTEPQT